MRTGMSQGSFLLGNCNLGTEILSDASESAARPLQQAPEREIDDRFVVSHSLPALYRAEVTNNAVMSVAHSS